MMAGKLSLALLVTIGYLIGGACAVDRTYYIAAVEEDWDYAPSGVNNLTGQAFATDTDGGDRMLRSATRIGRVYKKALFREYTDSTFRTQAPRPAWLGALGPVLKAEVGDRIVVHFRNMASRPYSINPGGLKYTKGAEGALYADGTSGQLKEDDNVQPNQTFIYRWAVTSQWAGPRRGQTENCIGWQYTSHRFSPMDQNSGLVGVTIVCRTGFLSSTDNDTVLMYGMYDENQSWYLDDNIRTYAPGVTAAIRETMGFMGSNFMYTVNGYSYGNLPGLSVCQGDARWFIFNFGQETSIHTVFFNGNPLEYDGKRADTIPVIPGPVTVVNMNAINPGVWLISSLSTTDAVSGGTAMYTVRSDCGTASTPEQDNGTVVEHFIAIQEFKWNYAPYVSKSPTGVGPTFMKALYVGYTDATFQNYQIRSPDEQYLGFIGPVIRAEVGSTIRVTLLNRASRAYNVHPNNVMYTKANEGYPYVDDSNPTNEIQDDVLNPGQRYTYNWTVPSAYGPTTNDPDCITGMYYSTFGGDKDLHSGLIGPLLVCKPGALDVNGTQVNVDREVITMIVSLNEERSWYWQQNQNIRVNADFPVEELRTLNGFVSDNLEGLTLCAGDRVSWHAPCIGNEETYMGLHIPQQTFVYRGRRANTLPLLPGQTEEVTFTAESPGVWVLNGNVYNYDLEMNYTVSDCYRTMDSQRAPKKERTIYLAAEEVIWDFAPTEFDYIRNQSLKDPASAGYHFVEDGPTYIGRKYKKVRFVEYTDDTFSQPKNRSYGEQHLGIMGPMIRVQVDETMKIVFKNNATREYSVNAHNLPGQVTEYMGQTFNEPITVQPGETATYKWTMLEKAGPTDDQPKCVVWPYYSSTVTKKDTNSGLIAPLVVCRSGTLNDNGERKDVDRDFALLYTIFDENDNWYLDDNIRTYTREPSQVDKLSLDFEHSNDAFAINGYIFGYPLNISMVVGERVAWYFIIVGGGADVHSINFHGHTLTERTHVIRNRDSITGLPGDFLTAEMEASQTGTWLLHDACNKHAKFGGETRYTVYAKGKDIPCGAACGKPPGTGGGAERMAMTLSSIMAALLFVMLI